jgi:hypothetical protein
MGNSEQKEMNMADTYRITAVAVAGDKTLSVTFGGGKTMPVNLAEPISALEVFAALEDPAVFASATVADYGWSVEWANGASIAAERLYQRALAQAGRAMPTEAFRAWMNTHHLSLTEAAAAIGLTRRTVSQYSSGNRPIPRTVALACKGWEVERR